MPRRSVARAVAAVAKLLNDDDGLVRLAAMDCLRDFGDRHSATVVVTALSWVIGMPHPTSASEGLPEVAATE